MTAPRATIWTDPLSFDDLVRSIADVVVNKATDEAGDYYWLRTREQTEFRTRPVRDADMAALRAGGVG